MLVLSMLLARTLELRVFQNDASYIRIERVQIFTFNGGLTRMCAVVSQPKAVAQTFMLIAINQLQIF